MIFKLTTKELLSNSGALIKKLDCPYLAKWQDMNRIDGTPDRVCSTCDKTIFDTEAMSDNEVIHLTNKNPNACLKVNLNQDNISVINIYE